MSNWKEYTLGDISRNISRRFDFNAYPNVVFINTGDVLNNKFLHCDISNVKDLPGQAKKAIKKGDILYSEIRPGNGRYLFVDNDLDNYVVSTKFMVIEPNANIVLPEFLFLLLISNETTEYFKMIAESRSGTFPQITFDSVSSLSLNIPDKETQQKILDIIIPLDGKIEINTQINQTLEQISQALFKSWFVDFDPVRAKVQALSDGLSLEQAELAAMQAISGKTPEELTALSQTQPERYAELAETAKAFPCEMVEVDGVEVPKGWEVKRIDEIANIIKGKSYKSSELEKSKTALVTLKSFNRGGGYRLDGLKEYTGKYKSEQEVFSGELIIAYTDVTQAADVIGKPAMVMSDSNYQHLVISLDVGVVRPFNDVYKHFLYCLAMTDSFQAHTKSFCTGTTVLHLGKDAVPSFEFINPSNELLHVFYKQTSPIFEKINLHIEENKNLEKVIDLLLPSLLSGRS